MYFCSPKVDFLVVCLLHFHLDGPKLPRHGASSLSHKAATFDANVRQTLVLFPAQVTDDLHMRYLVFACPHHRLARPVQYTVRLLCYERYAFAHQLNPTVIGVWLIRGGSATGAIQSSVA